MNKTFLSGRLVKEPDIRFSNDGQPIARYSLAVDRPGKDKGADFINCVAFAKNAEFAEKYLHKGMKIIVIGHIQTGSYEGKNGKVYTTDVIVDGTEFCESKKPSEPQAPAADGFMDVPDDVDSGFLPFN